MITTETDVSEQIRDAIYETGIYNAGIASTNRFEDVGMMTNDTGFVIKM